MSHHTTLEEHIEYEILHGEEQEEYMEDPEYLSAQCPACKVVFQCDEEMLAHICAKENKWEY